MAKQTRQSWRSEARDEFLLARTDGTGYERLSFITYLVYIWPRGYDWDPCVIGSGLQKLHDTPRDKRGHLSGKPRLRAKFVNWLDQDHENSHWTYAEIGAAIQRAHERDHRCMDVLIWRQGRGPWRGLRPREYMAKHDIGSHSTLTTRLYRAAELVVDEVARGRVKD